MQETTITTNYRQNLDRLKEQLKTMLPESTRQEFSDYEQELNKAYPDPLRLKKGDKAPDFILTDALGSRIRLKEQVAKGKVVLVFYRGEWCPYCNLQLNLYQKTLGDLGALGASLLAVSPQNLDKSQAMQAKHDLRFSVLSDPGNHVSRQYTTVFKNSDKVVGILEKLGYDYASFYDDKSRDLPIPAVFIIDENQTIIWAKTEGGDYKNRVDPMEILKVLNS